MKCMVMTSLAFVLLSPLLMSAADPDFSGTWNLDESRSELRRSPERPWKLMRIEHKDTEVRCIPVDREVEPKKASRMVMQFATNGKETAHPIGDATGKSIAKWEGSALMVNTLVSSPQRSYTQMDRWKLSRDGKVLTVRRQIVTIHGEVESTLVYDKQEEAVK